MENKKILIVEDDLQTIDALAFKLNQKGISASTALNGEEAIERLKREKYDLVLVDILLPKKNGFEVIKEAKTNGRSKDAKIIIFSNLGQEENVEKAMELGANGYIVKADIGINELSNRIIKELMN
jgi:DNA-binding response OmpR family regulator